MGPVVEIDQGDEEALVVAITGEDDVVPGLLGADNRVADVIACTDAGVFDGQT